MDVEGFLELREDVVGGDLAQIVRVLDGLTRAGAEAVDAEAAGELTDPGAHGFVVTQGLEPLVHASEHLLEDVFGVRLGQAERLDADRVDVAREPFDERAPRLLVTAPALRDEPSVGELGGQRCWAARRRFAIVSSSFHAMEALDSTSGRNSQEVSP